MRTAAHSTLRDLRSIPVDTALPIPARLERFRQDLGDPYRFRVGDVAVQVEFAPGGEPLQSLLLRLGTK